MEPPTTVEKTTTLAPCWPLHDVTALVAAVCADSLDDELSQIIDTINLRTAAIAQHRTEAAMARLALNDHVRIGNRVDSQYLRGEPGIVHGSDGDIVIVLLDRVVRRFTSRHARCIPEMVEPIEGS